MGIFWKIAIVWIEKINENDDKNLDDGNDQWFSYQQINELILLNYHDQR